jgi:hypothetical protein
MIDNKVYLMHRLAWLYMTGSFPTEDTDHINHNRSDNRFKNLREVNRSINHQNRKQKTNNSSGHLGVVWHKQSKAWQAQITANYKSHYLGLFKNFDDAVLARKKAQNKFHPKRPDNSLKL